MVYFPSERVINCLFANEQTFCFELTEGVDPSIVYKNSSINIKKITKGKKVYASLYKIIVDEKKYLLISYNIEGEMEFFRYGFVYSKESIEALEEIIKRKEIDVFLVNENNVHQASGKDKISNVIKLHREIKTEEFELFDFKETVPNYQKLFDEIEKKFLDEDREVLIDFLIDIKEWQSTNAIFIHDNGTASKINILDGNEGYTFEDIIAVMLKNVFQENVFIKLDIESKKGIREWTDVIAIHSTNILLIEAKAQEVFGDVERTKDRIDENVKKQIRKAIKQIIGANKVYNNGFKSITSNGKSVEVPLDCNLFNLIVVSELPEFNEEDGIYNEIEKTLKEKDIFIIILDIENLSVLTKNMIKNPKLFFVNLLHLGKDVFKYKNLNIRLKKPKE